jgi:predicted dehydrogenase
VINTPSVTHFEYTKMALLAGKHVVVEKPFTATVEEAKELIALAKSQNLKLSVYHNRRYDSDFKTVKKVLDEKLLGPIVDAEIRYDRFVPELSYKTHKETPTAAVGSLYDLGSHLIDQALQLFGMPRAVSADIAIFRDGSKVDDYFDVKLYYDTHRVSLKSSYYVREAMPGFQIHGKKGSFIKTKADVQEALLLKGQEPTGADWGIEPESQRGLLHAEIDGKVVREHISSLKGDYAEYYRLMYDALVNNAPLPVDAEEAVLVIRVIEAAYESRLKKQIIDL